MFRKGYIVKEITDCHAGEQLKLTLSSKASVTLVTEVEYHRVMSERGISAICSFWEATDYTTVATFLVKADGTYYAVIDPANPTPDVTLQVEHVAAAPFVFNAEHTDEKIVRRIPGESPCSIKFWEEHFGHAIDQQFFCFSCYSLYPREQLRCIPVKIASAFEGEQTYVLPVCIHCAEKEPGFCFTVNRQLLVKAPTLRHHTKYK